MQTDKKQNAESGKLMDYRVLGIPLWIFILGALVLAIGFYVPQPATPGKASLPSAPLNITAVILVLFVFGHLWGEIGDRIPIWKDYFGGGALLAFIGTSVMVSEGVIPKAMVTATNEIFGKYGALDLWIAITISSSILGIDRKLLGRAVGGFIPMVLVGTVLAFAGAILGGILVGIPYKTVILNYALPIMGGGNGAGALPMSQIWASKTGGDPKVYYSAAIAVLTIANVMAVIVGALLNGVGKKFPHLTGNGEIVKNKAAAASVEEAKQEPVKTTIEDGACGLFVVASIYVLSNAIGQGLLPTIGGVSIHPYAYMVVLLILANAFNIFSPRIVASVKLVNKFMMDKLFYVFLAGVGISFTNFKELVHAANFSTLVICFLTVMGAVIGCWFFAKVIGFYEIESAIAAGLCHVNRGGSGDMEVLGASRRMNLMSWAQIATRLGGAMILVLAGVLFGVWAK